MEKLEPLSKKEIEKYKKQNLGLLKLLKNRSQIPTKESKKMAAEFYKDVTNYYYWKNYR